MLQYLEYLNLPSKIAIALVALFLVLQIGGEILEFMGKVVPEFFKIRKFFKRRKDEKEKQKKLLEDVQKSLNEINAHYSQDNISKRDKWMDWVNGRAAVYDAAIDDLTSLKDALRSNNELTLDLYINVNRNRIIDFASKVANESILVSREEFNRIFKVHADYESILEKYGKTNGEVDFAFSVISDAYQERLRNQSFLEDIRGRDVRK